LLFGSVLGSAITCGDNASPVSPVRPVAVRDSLRLDPLWRNFYFFQVRWVLIYQLVMSRKRSAGELILNVSIPLIFLSTG